MEKYIFKTEDEFIKKLIDTRVLWDEQQVKYEYKPNKNIPFTYENKDKMGGSIRFNEVWHKTFYTNNPVKKIWEFKAEHDYVSIVDANTGEHITNVLDIHYNTIIFVPSVYATLYHKGYDPRQNGYKYDEEGAMILDSNTPNINYDELLKLLYDYRHVPNNDYIKLSEKFGEIKKWVSNKILQ